MYTSSTERQYGIICRMFSNSSIALKMDILKMYIFIIYTHILKQGEEEQRKNIYYKIVNWKII